jgi:hypothetical protein
MSWLDSLAPILGGVGGFLLGGPTGALAGASIGSGISGASAAKEAANTQAQATQAAQDAQERMFNKQLELQEPFRQAGIGALNKLIPLSDYTKFGMEQYQADPGYGFRLSEGMKALDRTAAARGGLLSGAALKGAQRYGQDLASQEYQNAFNRYQTERAAQLNPLQSLAGVGQTAAGTLTNAYGAFGSQTGQNLQDIGTARASGYLGGQNALNQALGQAGQMYQYGQRSNALAGMYGGGGSGAPIYTATPSYTSSLLPGGVGNPY